MAGLQIKELKENFEKHLPCPNDLGQRWSKCIYIFTNSKTFRFLTSGLFSSASFWICFCCIILAMHVSFLWVQRLFSVFIDELRFISWVNINFNMMHQINVCSVFGFKETTWRCILLSCALTHTRRKKARL